jgi:hypothetical protein
MRTQPITRLKDFAITPDLLTEKYHLKVITYHLAYKHLHSANGTRNFSLNKSSVIPDCWLRGLRDSVVLCYATKCTITPSLKALN